MGSLQPGVRLYDTTRQEYHVHATVNGLDNDFDCAMYKKKKKDAVPVSTATRTTRKRERKKKGGGGRGKGKGRYRYMCLHTRYATTTTRKHDAQPPQLKHPRAPAMLYRFF